MISLDKGMCDNPDVEMMLRVKQGDEAAFAVLCGKYRQALTGFFYSLCWNHHSAQDWTQEVLVRLWLSRERYEPTARLSTYVFRIARNYWLSELRKRKCRPEPMYLEDMWQPFPTDADLERVVMRRYRDRRIRQAIADLPEHYRFVFVLSHFHDMKYSQIAEVLEIPIGTVKSRMSAAVRLLRNRLSDDILDG